MANQVIGMLRGLGVLAALILAGIGMLFVLDLIPREMLQEVSIKALMVLGILAAVGIVIGALLGKRE